MSVESDDNITLEMPRFPAEDAEAVFDDASETGSFVRPYPAHGGPLTRILRVAVGPDLMSFAPVAEDHQVIVGRDPEADLVLEDPTVSGRHARVTSDGGGQITVFDLGSKNGTAVNGERITRTGLLPGDQVDIGATVLSLELVCALELAHLEDMDGRRGQTGFHDSGAQQTDWLTAHAGDFDNPNVAVAVLRVDTTQRTHAVDDVVGRLLLHGVGARPVVSHDGLFTVVFPEMGAPRGGILLQNVARSVRNYPWSRLDHPGVTLTGVIGHLGSDEGLLSAIARLREPLGSIPPDEEGSGQTIVVM